MTPKQLKILKFPARRVSTNEIGDKPMTNHLKNIEMLHKVLCKSLFTFDGSLSYTRITEGLIKLANLVYEYPDTDTECLWYIGDESDYTTLDDLIVGAYWHYTEWHSGQYSLGYAALSALGRVYSPGRECGIKDNEAYCALNTLAEVYHDD